MIWDNRGIWSKNRHKPALNMSCDWGYFYEKNGCPKVDGRIDGDIIDKIPKYQF